MSNAFYMLSTEPDIQKTLKATENILPVLKPQPASYTTFWVCLWAHLRKVSWFNLENVSNFQISATYPLCSPLKACPRSAAKLRWFPWFPRLLGQAVELKQEPWAARLPHLGPKGSPCKVSLAR